MPEKSFTPVSVRRRSAAQRCANAHTASAAHTVVGAVESASTLAEISSVFRRFGGEINAVKCINLPFLHLVMVL